MIDPQRLAEQWRQAASVLRGRAAADAGMRPIYVARAEALELCADMLDEDLDREDAADLRREVFGD